MSLKSRKLAYLGMGIMGSSMAVNLARAGFPLTVWNRSPGREGLSRAREAGARIASSIRESVAEAELIFLCLNDASDLEQILFEEGGVADSAQKSAVVVDMSTTGPDCARRVEAALSTRGLRFLDAPVSGGDVGARNATLTIMVGGERAVYDSCLPVFECIGKNIHFCGPCGSGQALKHCNQVLCAVNLLAVCESIELAKKMGIDEQKMIEICGSGAAASWALSNLGPRIAKGDLEPGFMIKDMQKDLRLVESAALNNAVSLPACELASRKFIEAVELIGENGGRKGTQAMTVTYSR